MDLYRKCLEIVLQVQILKEPLPKTKNTNTILLHVQKLSTTVKQLNHHRKQKYLVSPCYKLYNGERSSSPYLSDNLGQPVSSYFYRQMHGLLAPYHLHVYSINTLDSGYDTNQLLEVLHLLCNVRK